MSRPKWKRALHAQSACRPGRIVERKRRPPDAREQCICSALKTHSMVATIEVTSRRRWSEVEIQLHATRVKSCQPRFSQMTPPFQMTPAETPSPFVLTMVLIDAVYEREFDVCFTTPAS